jgi:hypothetical protein
LILSSAGLTYGPMASLRVRSRLRRRGGREALRELLHRSPREFGRQTSLWMLADAAHISFKQGLTHKMVSGETIRATLKRLGVR